MLLHQSQKKKQPCAFCLRLRLPTFSCRSPRSIHIPTGDPAIRSHTTFDTFYASGSDKLATSSVQSVREKQNLTDSNDTKHEYYVKTMILHVRLQYDYSIILRRFHLTYTRRLLYGLL